MLNQIRNRTGFLLPPLFGVLAQPLTAQVRDIGEVADALAPQAMLGSTLITMFAFVLGVGLAIVGLMKLKANGENPGDPSSRKGTAFVLIFAGAAMVALPSLIGSGITTIFGDTKGAINPASPESYLNLR